MKIKKLAFCCPVRAVSAEIVAQDEIGSVLEVGQLNCSFMVFMPGMVEVI